MSRGKESGYSTEASPTKAIVLHVHSPRSYTRRQSSFRSFLPPEEGLEEAKGLAKAIGLSIEYAQGIGLSHFSPATLLTKGHVESVGEWVQAHEVSLVFLDGAISPVQQRNLEKIWRCKVIDRTGIILEIFGARARTGEGRLQVELATLTYQRSRLVKTWSHLERQRGGFGFTGGPGESQLELDRRLLDDRIVLLKKQLEQVKRTRALQRTHRQDHDIPLVALVGYTNAGKSTLFNRLTQANVLAQDMLFATLDPTLRKIKLPNGREALCSDTVGFISNLPPSLVAAFRATLEEVCQADLIVHVQDLSHPHYEAQAQSVEQILKELGMEEALSQGRIMNIYNKSDLCQNSPLFSEDWGKGPRVSALTGEGVDTLLVRIEQKLCDHHTLVPLTLSPEEGEALAWLYRHGGVHSRTENDEGIHLILRLSVEDRGRFYKLFRPQLCPPPPEWA